MDNKDLASIFADKNGNIRSSNMDLSNILVGEDGIFNPKDFNLTEEYDKYISSKKEKSYVRDLGYGLGGIIGYFIGDYFFKANPTNVWDEFLKAGAIISGAIIGKVILSKIYNNIKNR